MARLFISQNTGNIGDYMKEHELLVTEDYWYDIIESGIKTFDFRKGIREIYPGDRIKFLEADSKGNLTGKSCIGVVTFVLCSVDFPEHFGWNGGDFTIIQFGERKGEKK